MPQCAVNRSVKTDTPQASPASQLTQLTEAELPLALDFRYRMMEESGMVPLLAAVLGGLRLGGACASIASRPGFWRAVARYTGDGVPLRR